MSERAMLEIRHFTKSYGGKTKAADDVNLSVYGGDICGFIGHNGAGKSTTIRAVVGVLDFSRGEIFIDGHSVKDDPIACKQVTAYIPDNPDLYENLTGIQYLNFVADVFDIGAAERKERIGRYADLFEIRELLFPRHEAEGGDHLRADPRAEAPRTGRALCGT